MRVKYEGKSPSHLWYAWQYTKGFATVPFNSSTRTQAKELSIKSGLSVGSLLVGGAAAHYLVLIPLVPVIATIGALAGGGFFGFMAYHQLNALKKSPVVSSYVRKQEEKWVANKSQPNFLKRFSKGTALLLSKTGTVLGWGLAGAGTTFAGVGLLQGAGIIKLAATATSMATIAGGVMAFPIMIGMAVAAVPAGVVTALICRTITHKLEGKPAVQKKPMFFKRSAHQEEPSKVGSSKPANADFKKSAAPVPTTEMSDIRRRAAEARAAARKHRAD